MTTSQTINALQKYALADLKILKAHEYMMITDTKQGVLSLAIEEGKIIVSTNKNGETILETTNELELILFLMNTYTVETA